MRDVMMGHAKPKGRVGRIVASVNPLIPKPGTAYQWLPMEDPAITDRKGKRLRTLVADLDNVYFNIKSERHSYYQALMSLGDRRVAPAIEAAERNGGNWRAAVAESGVDADFYIFRDRSRDAMLPWDIIDGGMKSLVLPRGVRQGPPRGMDAAPEALVREQEVPAGPDLATPSPRPRPPACSCVRLENQVAEPVLRRAVDGRPEQRERPALAIDRVVRAGNVTFRPVPLLRSHTLKPISFSPSSGPSLKCSSASASLPGGLPLSFATILMVMTISPAPSMRKPRTRDRVSASVFASHGDGRSWRGRPAGERASG